MFDNDRRDKQVDASNQEIWKDLTVAEFRALRNLVLLLEENEGNTTKEDQHESEEALGLLVQMAQYQNEIKSLGSAVKKRSTQFLSLHANSNIWTFLTQTTKEIELSIFPKLVGHNLSQAHRTALSNLSGNPHLVIKPSDKGGNMVVMDELQYRNMCWDILKK